MGFLDSLITGAFGIGQQAMQNSYNAEEAEKNRQFQSEEARLARNFDANQAALQRRWSSQEAEQARAWQEEMNAKYNSISGKISQAEAAGVNPMFAVTGNAVSPASASASAPSGASASSHGSPSGSAATNGMLNILGAILDAKKLDSEINLIESEVDKNRAETERTGWLSKLSEREYKIITENNFDVREIESRLNLSSDQANAAFQLAGKYYEEAAKVAVEKDILDRSSDDKVKLAEYNRIMAEFEASLPKTLDNLSEGQSSSFKEWFGSILKLLLAFKK